MRRYLPLQIGLLILTVLFVSQSDAVGIPLQMVLPVAESINGSTSDTGCSPDQLAITDRATICGSLGHGSISHLIDGVSPDINTSNNTWASQLVTVKKGTNANIGHNHVILTFIFDTPVSVNKIEIDLFNCPDWNIGAPDVDVYLFEDYTIPLITRGQSGLMFVEGQPSNQSCDSLSTVTMTGGQLQERPYQTFHILVSFASDPSIDCVYVGEVKFFNTAGDIIDFEDSMIETKTSVLSPDNPTDVYTAVTSLVSTSSTASPPPPSSGDPADSNNSDVLIAIAAVVAVVVVALLVVLIVILVVAKKRRSSQAKLEALQDVVREGGDGEVELKRMESDRDAEYIADNPLYSEAAPVNGRQSTPINGRQSTPHAELDPNSTPYYDTGDTKGSKVADNPHYYTTPLEPIVSPPIDDDFYTLVDEKKTTLKRAPETENQLYASVAEAQSKTPSPAPPTESQPVYAMVDKSNRAKGQKPPGINNAVMEDEDISASPAIPPKSPDLQVYLSTQEVVSHPLPLPPPANQPLKVSYIPDTLAGVMNSNPNYESADDALSHDPDLVYAMPHTNTAPNTTSGPNTTSAEDEDIYSEAIRPSDFMDGGKKEQVGQASVESNPRIYSAIYSVAATKEKEVPPLQISSSNINEIKELGLGQFGKVVLATTIGLSLSDLSVSNDTNRDITIYVAVKKLRSNANAGEQETFNKEIKFMSRLNHPNVVRFLGVCYTKPAFIIMEYMENGDLSLFLQRFSEIVDIPTSSDLIATTSVTKMALQIACGMKYLASKNFVHRDLASRNCLVDENFSVKLADFGMSRNLYESHYYKIKGNAILPIRWMATECFYGVFSEKTDVWAFGITMWELFTLAKNKPYPHLADSQVVEDAVNKGSDRYIHPKPPSCPQAVYEVMLCCWNTNKKKRAKFDTLYDMLEKST